MAETTSGRDWGSGRLNRILLRFVGPASVSRAQPVSSGEAPAPAEAENRPPG